MHQHTHTISIPRACFSMKFCSLPELPSSSYSHVCRPFSQCNRHFVTSVTGSIGFLYRLPPVVVAMLPETEVHTCTRMPADKPAGYKSSLRISSHESRFIEATVHTTSSSADTIIMYDNIMIACRRGSCDNEYETTISPAH